MAIITAV